MKQDNRPPQGGNPPLSDELRARLVELAIMARKSDEAGLQAISQEANRLILQERLTPEQVLAALHFLDARIKLLTGHVQRPAGYREYTTDEVADLMQRYPKFTVACMNQFPGKRSAIDLEKVVKALNKGQIKPPQQW